MKKGILHLLGMLIITCATLHQAPLHGDQRPFSKVILWGHKLHSHTHSYIHWGFKRAFEALGYPTYWFDKNDNVRSFDFSNALFITEGNVDQGIPLRADCRYILHNCAMTKYKQLFDQGNCIILQVYSHDCIKRGEEKIGPCMHMDLSQKIIYLPWATDLLPNEIDAIKAKITTIHKKRAVYMVGSVGGSDRFENRSKHDAFRRACEDNGVQWLNPKGLSMDDNIRVTQESLVAPALQSQWQCDNGYIPCRIFKNISYGQFGVTNSKTVWELFDKKIVYNSDTYQLFYDAVNRTKNMNISELYELMDFVRDNHTYLNRIERLLWFMNLVKPLA